MKMFNKKIIGLLILIPVFVFTGCEDFSSVEVESQSNEQVDFSNYVAVGNSLTAGLQSNALYETAQEYSFPNLLARQFHVIDDFEQPIISEPGIGERIQLNDDLEPTSTGDGSGTNLNANLERPYNNLGIPGAILADFTGTDLPGLPYSARQDNNSFFDVILRDFGDTQAEQMAAQEPTFVTFWQGNNDVLGYVTSGGEGQTPTDPNDFNQLYQGAAQALSSTGANVVVYNIPDVTSIPFVFYLRLQLEQQGAIIFNEDNQAYQLVTDQGAFDIYIEVDGSAEVMRQDDFLLLSAQSYFAQVQAGEVQPPIQPQNAIPDNLVLDGSLGDGDPTNSELEQAAGAVAQYNNIIQNIASSSGFTLVDINTIFDDIITTFQESNGQNGYQTNGLNLRPVPGEIFSFDGVHPTNRGHGIITNETIDVINNAHNTNLSKVDISEIPLGFPVAAN